ncbi:MAG: VWA domain-containing protein [Candidatus Riflebacteria bacterium]|nr:VWA domain-containing protein [Candidatus Riflebacteria bacterium]
MLSFGHPLFLTGLLTAAVPIWLHLYFRRTPVPKDFPSLRLIRLSVDAVIRRLKLRNWLLLALRLAVLLLLVLALARPFVGGTFGNIAHTGSPSAFVVILDNSLSMGVTHQGISLYNSAKAKALEVLDQMGPYDKASVALLHDPGTLLFTQLSWDKNDLKEAVRNAPLSLSGTNLTGVLQAAVKLVAPVRSYKRTVYLITDLTRVAWKPLLDNGDLLARIDPGIELVLIPVGDGSPPNLAVAGLELEQPLVMKGRTAVLWATVANHSDRPRQTRLSILVAGDKKQDLPIDLEARSRKRVKVPITFPAEGVVDVAALLPADSLPEDDVRHLAVPVLAPPKILVVKPPPERDGSPSRDDIFLRFALNPLNRTEGATFLVESRLPEEAVSLRLADYTAVFLVNQRQLPAPFVDALAGFVLGGGYCVIFPGSRTDPEWYNSALLDALGGRYLLPARLFKRVGNAVSRNIAYQLTDLDTGHPAFSLFGAEGNGDPRRAQVWEFFQVQPNPGALVLARMSHGLPGLVEERRGQGKTLLVTFTADTAWTNWPLKPTFLPFLHQALAGMLGRRGLRGGSILPGAPVSLVVQEENLQKVTLLPPQGAGIELPIRREGEGLLHISTTRTEQTGFYRLVLTGKEGTRTEAFAVNPPPDESDLERIPARKIPRFTELSHRAGSATSLGQKVQEVREGRDVSGGLLWLLLVVALVETALANRPPAQRPGVTA